MRTTSLKTIYLTEKELKQAISNWIELEHKDTELAIHLEENVCDMSWSQDGKEFIISSDGEVVDRVRDTDNLSVLHEEEGTYSVEEEDEYKDYGGD